MAAPDAQDEGVWSRMTDIKHAAGLRGEERT